MIGNIPQESVIDSSKMTTDNEYGGKTPEYFLPNPKNIVWKRAEKLDCAVYQWESHTEKD